MGVPHCTYNYNYGLSHHVIPIISIIYPTITQAYHPNDYPIGPAPLWIILPYIYDYNFNCRYNCNHNYNHIVNYNNIVNYNYNYTYT